MIKLRRAWAFLSSFCAGIRYRFEFEETIDWRRIYVICPNHTSNLDISMISILLKTPNYCFMGKEELKNGLITGIFFRTVDIAVNRDNKISAFRAFKAAADRLKAGKHMIMFAEGGIADEYPPQLQSFKNGPFRLAIELKIPVLPVTSVDTWKTLWDTGHKYGSKPGVCNVYIHKPIETAHLKPEDADALRDKVFATINQKLKPDAGQF